MNSWELDLSNINVHTKQKIKEFASAGHYRPINRAIESLDSNAIKSLLQLVPDNLQQAAKHLNKLIELGKKDDPNPLLGRIFKNILVARLACDRLEFHAPALKTKIEIGEGRSTTLKQELIEKGLSIYQITREVFKKVPLDNWFNVTRLKGNTDPENIKDFTINNIRDYFLGDSKKIDIHPPLKDILDTYVNHHSFKRKIESAYEELKNEYLGDLNKIEAGDLTFHDELADLVATTSSANGWLSNDQKQELENKYKQFKINYYNVHTREFCYIITNDNLYKDFCSALEIACKNKELFTPKLYLETIAALTHLHSKYRNSLQAS